MTNGIVKWFNDRKSFGFIQADNGNDVFVHFSAIQDSGFETLQEAKPVSFEFQNVPKGLSAINVKTVYTCCLIPTLLPSTGGASFLLITPDILTFNR